VAVSLVEAVPGGAGAILEAGAAAGHLRVLDWRPSLTEMTGLTVGLTFFLQMMQDYGTDQVTVQRLMSVRTDRGLAKAIVFNACSDFFIIALLLFIGLGLFAFYQVNPVNGAADLRADQILPFYVLHGLPDGVSGLIVTAIFAAAMSSMDSGINSLATVISNDFVKPFRTAPADDHATVTRARWYTVGLGLFATFAAFGVRHIGDIIDAFATFMSLFGAPVLALFLLGIFTRRVRFESWLVGVLVSLPATLWLQHGTEVNWTYYFPFSFLVTLGVAYAVSAAWRGPPAEAELTWYGRKRDPAA
jgi:Na+/proline symporter